MADALLTVQDLSLGFRGDGGFAHILDGANMSMRRGEIVGLVGESGCGKTTLARAILGVLPRNALDIRGGRIDFDGVDMLGKANAAQQEAVRRTSMTSATSPKKLPWLSVLMTFLSRAKLLARPETRSRRTSFLATTCTVPL